MRNLGKIFNFFLGKGVAAAVLSVAIMVVFGSSVSQAGEAELKEEIDKIWTKLANIESTSGVDNPSKVGPNWADRMTISGVIEVEGTYNDGEAGNDNFKASDIALATVELGVDAEVSDSSAAHILFLYEDGEDLLVDEAFITLGNTEKNPLYLTAGRMYVPFGNFETQMVSDPLTLEIGEAQEDALQVGVDAGIFYSSVYTFNGDSTDGGDDIVEHYGANLGFAFGSDTVTFDFGGGWLSSIKDTDGLTDPLVADYIDGYAAHLIAGIGPVTLIGEYVGADDDLNGAGTNTQISAYNVEAGILFPIAGHSTSIAVGYQETDEALLAGLPEKRILSTFAIEIMDGTALAFEWLNEEDYEVSDGGTGTDWDVYTLQLAAEF